MYTWALVTMPEHVGSTSIILDENNYPDWVIYIEAILIEKDLFDYVDGTETRPAGSDNHKPVKAFVKRSALARACIVKHVRPSQYPHCRSRNPVEIWRELERIHIARGFGSRQSLMRKFMNSHWSTETTMEKWIADITHQAHRLQVVQADITDQWIILTLTNGLPSEYDNLVESLDMVDPASLTLDYVKTRLLNSYTKKVVKSEEEQNLAMAARFKGSLRSTVFDKSKVKCHRCKGIGHFRNECPSGEELDEAGGGSGKAKSALAENSEVLDANLSFGF